MIQSIEIEFKNELTQIEYEKIKYHFHLEKSQFFLQDNHYFDTPSFALKEQNSALRIRKKGEHYELTLKQPVTEGILETNQVLTKAEAKSSMEQNLLPEGHIAKLIGRMNIEYGDIQFFGTLSTKRAEWEYESGLLVLDYSTYLNVEDFELEYEVTNREYGQVVFTKLLSSLQIPVRKTENKIKRFYLRKYQLWSSNQEE